MNQPAQSNNPPPDSLSSIDEHRMKLHQMLDDLKQVRAVAGTMELADVAEQANQIVKHIENNFFTVAVVGEFKRGKSTLINALLGKEILPADVMPCSATLNRVTYGPLPMARLNFKAKNGQPEHSVNISAEQLVDYVTKLTPESELKAADIKEAVVYFPTPYCRDKADIIDTPGLNDDENMTDVTLSVLPKVDAAIMVILAQSPFGGYEGEFLNHRMLMSDLGRVIFVVNRIDEIRKPEDRVRIIEGIRKRIKESVENRAAALYGKDTDEYRNYVRRIGEPKIFGVSAIQALDAKLEGDERLLAKSGFVEFEKALEHFLTFERGVVSLQVLADCTVNTSGKVLNKITIQDGVLQMREQEFTEKYTAVTSRLAELRHKHAEEQKKTEQAARSTWADVRPVLEGLDELLKNAALDALKSVHLTPADVEKSKQAQTNEMLSKEITRAMRETLQLHMEKIQAAIDSRVNKEIVRLGSFAQEANAALIDIQMQFTPKNELGVVSGLAAVPIVGAFFITGFASALGGLASGYQAGGVKGMLVGGGTGLAAGAGAMLGATFLASAVGLTVGGPVILGILGIGGLVSTITGKKATELLMPGAVVDKYLENYKKVMLPALEEQIDEQKKRISGDLQSYINDTFTQLKDYIQRELGAPIDQTQATLDDLRQKMSSFAAEREIRLKQLAEMRNQVANIQNHALRQSQSLREITSV